MDGLSLSASRMESLGVEKAPGAFASERELGILKKWLSPSTLANLPEKIQQYQENKTGPLAEILGGQDSHFPRCREFLQLALNFKHLPEVLYAVYDMAWGEQAILHERFLKAEEWSGSPREERLTVCANPINHDVAYTGDSEELFDWVTGLRLLAPSGDTLRLVWAYWCCCEELNRFLDDDIEPLRKMVLVFTLAFIVAPANQKLLRQKAYRQLIATILSKHSALLRASALKKNARLQFWQQKAVITASPTNRHLSCLEGNSGSSSSSPLASPRMVLRESHSFSSEGRATSRKKTGSRTNSPVASPRGMVKRKGLLLPRSMSDPCTQALKFNGIWQVRDGHVSVPRAIPVIARAITVFLMRSLSALDLEDFMGKPQPQGREDSKLAQERRFETVTLAFMKEMVGSRNQEQFQRLQKLWLGVFQELERSKNLEALKVVFDGCIGQDISRLQKGFKSCKGFDTVFTVEHEYLGVTSAAREKLERLLQEDPSTLPPLQMMLRKWEFIKEGGLVHQRQKCKEKFWGRIRFNGAMFHRLACFSQTKAWHDLQRPGEHEVFVRQLEQAYQKIDWDQEDSRLPGREQLLNEIRKQSLTLVPFQQASNPAQSLGNSL